MARIMIGWIKRVDRALAIKIALLVIGILVFALAVASSWSGKGTFIGITVPQIVSGVLGLILLALGLFTGRTRFEMLEERIKLSRLVGLLIVGLVGLVILEIVVRIFEPTLEKSLSATSGFFSQVDVISDAKLGFKIAPNASGHDSNGFRNLTVPARADIVVLGDSQTWGQAVDLNETWPQALTRLSGQTVYNMGINGYGPVEWWLLTEQALKISPKTLVIGLYTGLDLWQAYASAYSRDALAELRVPAKMDQMAFNVTATGTQTPTQRVGEMADQLQFAYTPGWLTWLGKNTGIGRVAAFHGRWPGFTERDEHLALQNAIKAVPDYGLFYDIGSVQTILTTSYRLAYTDRHEPRVLEGIRITKEMLLRIQHETNAANVKLVVLLIPTKELVYSRILSARHQMDDTYNTLVQMETLDREEMRDYCTEHSIQVIDALSALQDAADKNQAIYQASSDGHPQASGYALIASTVNAALDSQ